MNYTKSIKSYTNGCSLKIVESIGGSYEQLRAVKERTMIDNNQLKKQGRIEGSGWNVSTNQGPARGGRKRPKGYRRLSKDFVDLEE